MTWSPTFIGIGAEKSATTWAWTMLNEHPSVCMSQPKELNYFNIDENFQRGASWYRKHFAIESARAGEISPLYMDDERVAGRIRDTYPDARILVMLRNPFGRAMSHLFHDASVLYGKVAELTKSDLQALASKDQKYVRRSCYAAALAPFLEAFPRDQIGIFLFEDVATDGLELAQNLYDFVGVDAAFVPEQYDQKVNESQDLRSVGLAKVMMSASRLARSFPPTRQAMNWVYRRTQLRETVIRWLLVDKGRPQIDFSEVFSPEATSLLDSDLQLLKELLPEVVPTSWLEGSPAERLPFGATPQPAAA
ncbi:sulfotransferase family protein [Fuerstiella marisgermanici]|uniref:Sulfotransferase domain protein n=1 Tax=Fuerstiella marisgermanici TaxID=1891926 RepID=A0A1P8WKU4_9PLAN|nr:sulfotransferase [Fuerstiella marisgermanici]APZ94665.1 Sulfotransferase domain protein [Fuerstiella marisgermanici]